MTIRMPPTSTGTRVPPGFSREPLLESHAVMKWGVPISVHNCFIYMML
jgi:hypothetical protein